MGAITLLVFFLRLFLFRLQESPKFLLYRGHDEKAIKVIQHVAQVNNKPCNLTIESFSRLSNDTGSTGSSSSGSPILGSGAKQAASGVREKISLEWQRYKLLFANATMIRLTILLLVIYAFDFWGFTIAGSFLPRILEEKNAALGVSLRETYRDYVYIYIFGIPGVFLGAVLYRGRWFGMLFSSAMMATSLFIFTQVHNEATYIGINGLVYFFQSMFNAILYGWTPENFDAPIRGTACGVASFVGRLFSIVSPLIAGHLLASSTNAVLYLAGGGVFVCTVAIALLPRKVIGRQSY